MDLLAGPFSRQGGSEVFIDPGSVATLDQAADLARFLTQVRLKSDHTLTLTNELKEPVPCVSIRVGLHTS